MARIVLCLLLLPAMLFGQIESAEKASGFRVEKQEIQKIEKPTAKAVEVLRTETAKIFDTGLKTAKGERVMQAVIGAVPIHRDSAGVMVEYDLSDKAAKTLTKDAGKAARIGASTVEYDTTGRFRWEKEGSWFSLSPVFKTGTVGIKMRIEPGQVKTDYILDEKSPTRLAWGLKESWKGVAERKISPPIAWDAEGKPVPVEQIFTSDSLIWSADTKGAVWPVTIDPTVQDTISPLAASGGLIQNMGSTYVHNRDSLNAVGVYIQRYGTGGLFRVGTYQGTPSIYVTRTYLSFPLGGYSTPASVDSVRLFIRAGLGTQAGQAFDSLSIWAVQGTFSGASVGVDWFSQFEGRTVGSAHTSTNMLTEPWLWAKADSGQWKNALFTAAANDTVKERMTGGNDTLRIALLGRMDMYRVAPAAAQQASFHNTDYPYLVIHYTEQSPPTVSVVSDTVLPVIRFVGNITVANVPPTVRGAKYWPSGTGDTVAVADTGSFATGEFVVSSRPVFWNTTYLYKLFAVNVAGIGESALDSVRVDSIGTGTGAALIVDGRVVNRRW